MLHKSVVGMPYIIILYGEGCVLDRQSFTTGVKQGSGTPIIKDTSKGFGKEF